MSNRTFRTALSLAAVLALAWGSAARPPRRAATPRHRYRASCPTGPSRWPIS